MTATLVCYTARFGNLADRLYQVPATPEFEFFAYTDQVKVPTPHSTGWVLMPPVWRHSNPQWMARRHKALSHLLFPSARYTLWVDSTFTPKATAEKYLGYLQGEAICTYRHAARNCLYQEAEQVIRSNKAWVTVVRQQVAAYRKAGHPYHTGLPETPVVLRQHTHGVIVFNNAWWAEMEKYSLRDQISFPYVSHRLGIDWAEFPDTAWKNPLFDYRQHIYQYTGAAG